MGGRQTSLHPSPCPPGAPPAPPPAAPWEPLTRVQDDEGGGELLSCQQPVGKVVKPGWSCVGMTAKARGGLSPRCAPGKLGGGGQGQDPPAQHDGGAVGEVAGPGAVTDALQREAKADKAGADGEAEFEQEAEQEVVLGLQREGRPVTPAATAPLAPRALGSTRASGNVQAGGRGSFPPTTSPSVGGSSDSSPHLSPEPRPPPHPCSSGKAQAHWAPHCSPS